MFQKLDIRMDNKLDHLYREDGVTLANSNAQPENTRVYDVLRSSLLYSLSHHLEFSHLAEMFWRKT